MAYIKTNWKDQKVERPKTYELQENSDGTYTLLDRFGQTDELGTPVNALNMNHIEEGIDACALRKYNPKETFKFKEAVLGEVDGELIVCRSLQVGNVGHELTDENYWKRINISFIPLATDEEIGGVTLDTVNQSKAFLTGNISTNPEVFADIKDYAHSTFDISKFKIINKAFIDDNGMLSNCTNNDFVNTNYKIGDFLNHSWSIISPIVSGIDENDYGCYPFLIAPIGWGADGVTSFTGKSRRIDFTVNTPSDIDPETRADNRLSVQTVLDKIPDKLICRMDFNYQTGIYSCYYDIFDGSGWILAGTITPQTKEKQLFDIIYNTNKIEIGRRDNSFENSDVIDINSCKVYVDGKLIYQPLLKIPYTLSKTGSKIADTNYRTRIQDMYEQFGYAPYYTLDEVNKNFTLPMGEIYGMIEKRTKYIDDILRPIGKPIISMNNDKLLPDEIWLEGDKVLKNTYPKLTAVYGDDYAPLEAEDTDTYLYLPD